MSGHRWNKIKQRLAAIIAPELEIAFNNGTIQKKTSYSEIKLRFFQIKLDGEIIWEFPKDSKITHETFLYGYIEIDGNWKHFEDYPVDSIVKYIDLPKEQLLDYEDKAGISDILKVCDKRIGYNRLKELKLSPIANKIFDVRFGNKKEVKDKNQKENKGGVICRIMI